MVLAFVTLWNLTPGVSDAEARTAAIVASHDGISDGGIPPQKVSQALVATEDSRFYSHPGLDAQSIARGLYTFVTQGSLQGATLDAQLAKLLYSADRTGVWPTTQEAMLADQAGRQVLQARDPRDVPRRRVLRPRGLGRGEGVAGLLRRRSDQLSWGQASLLAGLVNAPTAYDPTAHLTLARVAAASRARPHGRDPRPHPAQADAVFAEPLNPALPFTG